MPNTVKIKRLLRKEPTTREDYVEQALRREGILKNTEQPVFELPKAPGVFSLGPDYSPVQVPNTAVDAEEQEKALSSVQDLISEHCKNILF